jgi:hypothetical protein
MTVVSVLLGTDRGTETGAAISLGGRSVLAQVADRSTQDPVRQASEALMQWRRDWENRDFERFAAHYSDAYRSGGLDRITYLERKRVIFEKRPWQRVRINEVLWVAEHGSPDSISVRFVQEYDSPQGGERGRKEQRWIRTNQRWQLASEIELPLSEIDTTKAKPKSGTGGTAK